MQLYINNQDISYLLINNDYSYSLERSKDFSVDVMNLNLAGGSKDFEIGAGALYIANNIVNAEVYDDFGKQITSGDFRVLSLDMQNKTANCEIKSDIQTKLNIYPQYSYPFSAGLNPFEIIKEIFEDQGLEDFIDYSSLLSMSALMDSYNIYTQLDMNITEQDTTLFDVIKDLRQCGLMDIYVLNNKIYFDRSIFFTGLGYEIPDKYIVSIDESLEEDQIINDWSINTNGFSLSLTDIDNMTGSESRARFGSRKFEISPDKFEMSESTGSIVVGWFEYAIDTLNSLINFNDKVWKIYNVRLPCNVIEEIGLNDRVTVNNKQGYVIAINRNRDNNIIKVKVD